MKEISSDNKVFPLIPLRDMVVFPKMIAPLFIGRNRSIKAIEQIINPETEILLVSQKDSNVQNPEMKDLYTVGVVAKIIQKLKLPDGTLKILIEARDKVRINKVIENDGFMEGLAEVLHDIDTNTMEVKALMRSVISQFQEYSKYNPRINNDVFDALEDIKSGGHLSDIIASNLAAGIEKKQEILEIIDVKSRLKKLSLEIEYEISLIQTEQKIRSNVKKQMEKNQKDYFLNEQLKVIHKELSGDKDGENEISALEASINKTKFNKDTRDKALSELKKLKMTNSMSAEATIIRNYLDYLLSLPWGKYTKLTHDIHKAQEILDRDHYGLDKVKERIIEFLAVQKRTKSNKGPILCFVGPPGVGKTSLAKSIAEATGRNFVRFAMGGVRDEAEIRGHRKTYLGAMPGKIMYLMKKSASSNPVMLLDEVDKIGSDYRGDPAAALLEVLDPEQNHVFCDHYIESEYDLSKTLFIATANSTKMHRALLDRMEIIRLVGYTEDEKIHIAKKHLLTKQRKEHKLKVKEFGISDDAMLDVIRYYTKEAGVRGLEREIASLARKAVRDIEQHGKKCVNITAKNLKEYLGVRKYSFGETEEKNLVGVTTGLAYTEVGGDLLSIEALTTYGKGDIKTTGTLGDVMKESAQAAFTYFKSNCLEFGVTPPEYSNKNLHLHVPEGATPKDGPSAGIAIFTSIVSVMTNIPVNKNVAMTGEITLRGRVLPIGGLKEKLLAASRGRIKTVLIPSENEKDLEDVPNNIKKNLKIIPVKTAIEVLKYALSGTVSAVEWSKSQHFSSISQENTENSTFPH